MPDKKSLKDQLQQLSNLQREIQLTKEQLERLRGERYDINAKAKTDSVKGSMSVFPFVLHNITVKGLSDEELGQKAGIRADIQEAKERLQSQRAACAKEYNRLTEFIAEVGDSEMRQILTLRYVNGLSWQQVALSMGENDESYPRRKHNKFLKFAENAE